MAESAHQSKAITEQVADAVNKVTDKAKEHVASNSVFSMFGGGAAKQNVPDTEENDRSGSTKAQKALAQEKQGDDEDENNDDAVAEHDPHYEPIIHLTETVDVKTNEEKEDTVLKIRAKLFKFDRNSREWKERGVGDVKLLQNPSGKTRLVMRRDRIHKVCANHYLTEDMELKPNVGSDRSWVWLAASDISEGEAESTTFAIRFATSALANEFKDAFCKARNNNVEITRAEEGDKDSGKDAGKDAGKDVGPDAKLADSAVFAGAADAAAKDEAKPVAAQADDKTDKEVKTLA